MSPSEKLERPRLYVMIPMWIVLGLNIILNLYGAYTIVVFMLNSNIPRTDEVALAWVSVILTVLTALGTALMRRWAAIGFVVLSLIGMLPLFAGRLNVPGLTMNFLSCVVVLFAFRWMR
jgi:hypothetical protein